MRVDEKSGHVWKDEYETPQLGGLRILYVGISDDGTCKARRIALERMGNLVQVVNASDFLAKLPPIMSWFEIKAQFGPATSLFNRRLMRIAESDELDWVWIDKALFVYPKTIRRLSQKGLFVIHHLTDDFLNPNVPLRHYRRSIRLIHVHLTSNIYNVQELRELGAPNAVQTHLGFDPDLCMPGGNTAPPQEEFRADVVFMGHWRAHIDKFIAPLIEKGLDVKLWGPGWEHSRHRTRPNVMGRRPTDAEYPAILASAKVALCFLSRANRNTSTGRTFEIPAVGTFMLGERTDEHKSFFVEGQEAEFFDTPEELLEKTLHYLTYDEARIRIAQAGHKRATTSGYTYFDRIAADMKKIRPIYEDFVASGRRLERPFMISET
jgi:spore maturation protein CgeB